MTRWLWPETLDEALELRGALGDEALAVAGGTFVGVLAATGLLDLPETLIALGGVDGLAGIAVEDGDARARRDGDAPAIERERGRARRLAGARGRASAGRERARAQRRHHRRRAGRRRLRHRSAGDAAGARGRVVLAGPGGVARPRRRRADPRPLRRPRSSPTSCSCACASRGRARRAYVKFRSRSQRGPAVRRAWPRRGWRAARCASRSAPSSDRPLLLADVAGAEVISDLRGSAAYRRRMVDVHARRARGDARWMTASPAPSRYSQDVERPGMLHGRVVRSHHPHARVRGVTRRGRAAGGLRVAAARGRRRHAALRLPRPGHAVLARGVARYVGDPVAAVAAPTRARRGAARCAASRPTTSPARRHVARRGARRGRAAAARLESCAAPRAAWTGLRPARRQRPAPLPARCTAAARRLRRGRGRRRGRVGVRRRRARADRAARLHWPSGSDGRLTVWTGTQTPFNVRRELAGAFGLAEGDVRVISPPMGGTFGAKTFRRVEAIAAALARKAGRPVRVVLPRDEVFVTLNRHPARFRVRLGARARRHVRRAGACGPTGTRAPTPTPARTSPRRAAGRPSAPTASTTSRSTRAASTRTPVRRRLPRLCRDAGGVGLGAVRRPAGRAARRRPARPAAAERAARRRALRDRRDDARLPRRGVPRARRRAHRLERRTARQGAVRGDEGHADAEPLRGAHRARRRAFTVESATTEIGQGRDAEPAGAGRGRARRATPRSSTTAGVDTDISPFDTRTTSSRSTHMMAGAIGEAARELRRRLADELEAKPGDVLFVGERSRSSARPGRGAPLASFGALEGAASGPSTAASTPTPARASPPRTGTRARPRWRCAWTRRPASWRSPASRSRSTPGRVVDASGAALQNEGSIVMGVGSALFEAIEFADGQMLTTTSRSTRCRPSPTCRRSPPSWSRREGADVHGLGETALPLVPAALGNALRSLGLPRRACRCAPRRCSTRSTGAGAREAAHSSSTAEQRRSRWRATSRCSMVLRRAGLRERAPEVRHRRSAARARCWSTASRSRAACCTRRSPRAAR